MNALAEVTYAPLLFDTKIYFIVFGVIVALGGMIGYVKAQSVASLLAGGVSGLLLIVGALMIPRAWTTGVAIDFIVSLLLAGRFVPSLIRRKWNPASYVVPLAILGAVVAALLLFGVVPIAV